MRNLLFILALPLMSACAIGGYHVEVGPRGTRPIVGQNVDVILTNSCAPLITYYTAGVHRDSVMGRLEYGDHTTVRLNRPLFAGEGSDKLILKVDVYKNPLARPVMTLERSYYVDTWNSGKTESWTVGGPYSSDRCPKA